MAMQEPQEDPKNRSNPQLALIEHMREGEFAELIDDFELVKEGIELSALVTSMPPDIEEDQEWFFMPKRWLDKWEAWCYIDVIKAAESDDTAQIA